MKINKLLLSIIALILASCGSGGGNYSGSGSSSKHLYDPIGSPFEVYIVTPKTIWNSPVGDTIRYALAQDVEMLNQVEPQFTLVNIPTGTMNKINRRHRNIINVNIADTLAPSVDIKNEITAKTQIVVTFNAPSDSVMIDLIDSNKDELISLLEDSEFKRYSALAKKYRNKVVSDSVETLFGFEIDIPKNYNIRNVEEPDFMWISSETASVGQGIIIYSYPRSDSDVTSAEILTIKRNEFTSRIPGPSDGSFMSTSTYVFPEIKPYTINGIPWVEMRGLWSVQYDFMGGPFVSYTTINPDTNMVVTIEFYVYSPKPGKPKRNLMKQLESLIYSVKFPQ